jgi:hypothetical protein
MDSIFHFWLMGVGQNSELTQPEWGRAAQTLSSENKTFHHFGETGR